MKTKVVINLKLLLFIFSLNAALSVLVQWSWARGVESRKVLRSSYFAQLHPEHDTLDSSSLESFGRFEGRRKDTGGKIVIETKKLTFSSKGLFELMTYVTPANEKEEKKVGIFPGFHTTLKMTLEEYEKVFASKKDVSIKLPVREGVGIVYEIEAKMEGVKRKVHCNIATEHMGKRKEVGELNLTLKNGDFIAFELEKGKDRLILPGQKTVLSVESDRMKRRAKGLLLSNDGKMGRVERLSSIRRALADPNPSTFSSILKAEAAQSR